MLKKMKTMISLSVIICIGLFGAVTVGCNDDSTNDDNTPGTYSVAFEGDASWMAERSNFVAICNSLGELKNACFRNKYDYFDRRAPDYDSNTGEKIRSYTRDYFRNKSLVICGLIRTSDIGKFHIDSVEVGSGELTVKIKIPDSEVAYTRVLGFFFIIETDKSFVSEVTGSTYVLIL